MHGARFSRNVRFEWEAIRRDTALTAMDHSTPYTLLGLQILEYTKPIDFEQAD
jgi:hypothetical protein